MKNIAKFYLLIVSLSLLACTPDSAGLKPSELEGSWLCIDGTMDGDKATMMIKSEKDGNPGAEIIFKGNMLTFPILTDINKSKDQTFSILDKKIICKNDTDLVFTVKDKTSKKMTLAFALQGHNLELVLEKIK
jgi:hypothetical protein